MPRLSQRSELVFGDVQAVFEFLGDTSLDRSRADVEVIQTPGSRSVKTFMSEKTRPMSGTASVSQATAIVAPLHQGGAQLPDAPGAMHQEVYAHAKNELGMVSLSFALPLPLCSCAVARTFLVPVGASWCAYRSRVLAPHSSAHCA